MKQAQIISDPKILGGTKMSMQTEKLTRDCVVCGKRITVTLYPDKTYNGGHFFGKLNIGKRKKAEYWECNQCYARAETSTQLGR